MLINFVAFIINALATKILIPFFYNMLLSNGCIALNYKKIEIPLGMGLIFVITQSFSVFIFSLFVKGYRVHVLSYIIVMLLVGLIGLIDDIIGEKDIKGFKGHMKALIKGKLTTGGLKAIVGLASAFIFSLILTDNYLDILLNTVIVALFTNLINLFDLRPGRASKVFLLLSIVLTFTSYINSYNYIISSALGIIVIYIPYDLKSKAMMGDVGSNAIGITLGAYCILTQAWLVKIIYLAFLLFLHVISEFYSFSKIISNNRFLSYLDNLGRDTE